MRDAVDIDTKYAYVASIKGPKEVYVREGSPVTFTCEIVSQTGAHDIFFPKPRVRWLYEGKEITHEVSYFSCHWFVLVDRCVLLHIRRSKKHRFHCHEFITPNILRHALIRSAWTQKYYDYAGETGIASYMMQSIRIRNMRFEYNSGGWLQIEIKLHSLEMESKTNSAKLILITLVLVIHIKKYLAVKSIFISLIVSFY